MLLKIEGFTIISSQDFAACPLYLRFRARYLLPSFMPNRNADCQEVCPGKILIAEKSVLVQVFFVEKVLVVCYLVQYISHIGTHFVAGQERNSTTDAP